MKCYYFGTFNPVHKGHIKTGLEVKRLFGFEKVVYIPCFEPCHKKTLDFNHRYNMLKLYENDEIEVSNIESTLKTPSYSYQTVLKLNEKVNFILGYDAFVDIQKWKNPEILRKNCKFIVLKRKGEKRGDIEKLKDFNYDFIITDEIEYVDVSSSMIRQLVKENKNTDIYLDKKVREYIDEHNLYR